MLNNLKIHITPTDYMADIDEIADGSEPRSRCRYFIAPYGSHGLNEVCEANYFVGNRVPYHEHTSGFETFLVDGGAFEVFSQGKKAVARKGDFVHVAPYTPHAIYVLEDNSIWRAFHQGMYITQGMIDERRLRDAHPDSFFAPSFKTDMAARNGSTWFDFAPDAIEVEADKLGIIRPFDFAIADFTFASIEFKLKVGRWETGGAKEVWQLILKKGARLSWDHNCVHNQLYDIFSGSVETELEGIDKFKAVERDILHIPKFSAGTILALEDTVLLDCGCQGFLLRLLEELKAIAATESAKLKDPDFIRMLMRKHDYHVHFLFEN